MNSLAYQWCLTFLFWSFRIKLTTCESSKPFFLFLVGTTLMETFGRVRSIFQPFHTKWNTSQSVINFCTHCTRSAHLKLTMHVALVFILYECIAARLAFAILNHLYLLDWTKLLKLTPQLGLGCVVVLKIEAETWEFNNLSTFSALFIAKTYNSGNKQRLEWIFGGIGKTIWIPYCDFTLQLVGDLFSLLTTASFESFLLRLDSSWRWCVFWILKNECENIF